MYLKNTSGQKLEVFAFDYATGAPKTGDAGNLTAYVNIDEAGYGTLTDTSATEVDSTNKKGLYLFDLTQGETNGTKLGFFAKSSTASVSVIARPSVSFTQPTTGFLAPATAGRTLVVDASGLADANAVKVGPSGSGTAQTARDLGLSVLLSSGTGTGQLKLASGYVAMTWADIAAPTTTVALTGTTIAVTQKVDVETIKTNPVVNGGTITFPTTATLASTTNITAGTLTTVTTATNLTNAPTVGDFTSTMKTSIGTAVAASAVASVTGNVGGNVTGSIGSLATQAKADVNAEADTALADVGLTTTVTGRIDVAISTRMATYTQPTGFLAATFPLTVASTTNITAATGITVSTNGDKTGYALTSGERDSIAAALLDLAAGVETSLTLRQFARLVAAVLLGKSSNSGATFRDTGDTKNRLVATVDASGNRTAITRDAT